MKNKKRESSEEWYMKATCSRCGRCCREPVVPVNDSDVLRIVRGTGLRVEDIVDVYDKHDVDMGTGSRHWIRLSCGKRVMGLKRKANRCVFLKGRDCSIYPDRPVTCRTFPLSIVLDDSGDLLCLSYIEGIRCNRKRGPAGSLKEMVDAARWEDSEDRAYFEKVAVWNRRKRKGSWEDFLNYLFERQRG